MLRDFLLTACQVMSVIVPAEEGLPEDGGPWGWRRGDGGLGGEKPRGRDGGLGSTWTASR